MSKDDPVYLQDFRGIEGFDLHTDDLDAGHFTLFALDTGDWRAFFDFRMMRRYTTKLLSRATEFHTAAVVAYGAGHAGACIANLFTAYELAAKARLVVLLLQHDVPDFNKHGQTRSRINKEFKEGNVSEEFKETFNRLSQNFNPSRYDVDAVIAMPQTDELALLQNEIDLLARIAKVEI